MSIISAGGAVTGADIATPIDPREYFNTVLYTGTGSSHGVTGVGFQPDLVWLKRRDGANDHKVNDAVRGAGVELETSTTDAEAANANFDSFDADGFTVISGAGYNTLSYTYVAWNWKANGSGVSNTDGTITSTVSANPDAGFSIVSYTGNGTDGATVGHGLSQAPELMINKSRDSAQDWFVFGYPNNTAFSADGSNLKLNTTAAIVNSTEHEVSLDSSVITFVDSGQPNLSGDARIAYCFHSVDGFSKFGAYTGNGSATGPSVTTDFEPTFLMIKRTDSTGDWIIHDSARDATNPRTAFLEPNTSDAEGSGLDVDFNSTGFQIKSSSATINANGGTYIYMCIA